MANMAPTRQSKFCPLRLRGKTISIGVASVGRGALGRAVDSDDKTASSAHHATSERTLVNMADGYSRATNGRRLGVATVQHGPGAENAYAGVAQAFADGSPLLFLPGGNARGRDDLPPNFRAGEAYASVAKW